nr:MAG TPA: hypothetical protein [Caudoviricetes sp.]
MVVTLSTVVWYTHYARYTEQIYASLIALCQTIHFD